jgi:putative tryptophan/tyrosine transport system substrate-binding protein
MNRRSMMLLLSGAAAIPRMLWAQQKAVPVIGYLSPSSAASRAPYLAVFREELSKAGFVEGKNLAIEYRWAEGDYTRFPALVAELVGRNVDVIVTGGGAGILAAKHATSTIPIVFLGGGDLVTAGLVASLARPGGNLTGISIMSPELEPKRLELLSDLVPQVRGIALLVNPHAANREHTVHDVQEAARAKDLQLAVVKAGADGDFEAAFASLAQQHAGALQVSSDPFFDSHREQLVALAARYAIPAIYEWREFSAAGGLVSYGSSLSDAFRKEASYVGRILKGEKPADLPIQQPTKFELVVNLKTAKALGLAVPQAIARADEVIE